MKGEVSVGVVPANMDPSCSFISCSWMQLDQESAFQKPTGLCCVEPPPTVASIWAASHRIVRALQMTDRGSLQAP